MTEQWDVHRGGRESRNADSDAGLPRPRCDRDSHCDRVQLVPQRRRPDRHYALAPELHDPAPHARDLRLARPPSCFVGPVRITAGAAYFRLQGFVIENAPLDGTVNVYVSDGQQDQPQAAHDIEIRGNEIRNGKGTGLLVAPRTARVHLIGNKVHDNGFGTEHQHQGLYFQGQDGLISNNIVYDQPNGFGIQVRGEDTSINTNNVIVTQNTSVGTRWQASSSRTRPATSAS